MNTHDFILSCLIHEDACILLKTSNISVAMKKHFMTFGHVFMAMIYHETMAIKESFHSTWTFSWPWFAMIMAMIYRVIMAMNFSADQWKCHDMTQKNSWRPEYLTSLWPWITFMPMILKAMGEFMPMNLLIIMAMKFKNIFYSHENSKFLWP